MLQITHPRKKKVTTINVSNFVHIQPNIEGRTMRIVLPDNSEMIFKAENHQLLVLWIAALKVSMSKGILHITTYNYYSTQIFDKKNIEKINKIFCYQTFLLAVTNMVSVTVC